MFYMDSMCTGGTLLYYIDRSLLDPYDKQQLLLCVRTCARMCAPLTDFHCMCWAVYYTIL